jgi:hypothetical protein
VGGNSGNTSGEKETELVDISTLRRNLVTTTEE